jgi:hypothetical protein
MKGNLTLGDYERFSAYLDGQLSPTEQARLEKDLKARPDLRLALEEIKATRQVLRKASLYRAPRNFTLSPEVARQAARRALFPTIGFRFSTALATLAFVAVMALQILPGGFALQAARAPEAQTLAQPGLAAAPLSTQTEAYSKSAAQDQTTGEPPIIQWAVPGPGSGGGSSASALKGTGMGGGPQTSPGDGIVTYNGVSPANPAAEPGLGNNSVSIPNDSVASLPPSLAAAATALPQAMSTESTDRSLESGGPVLGLPEQGSAGQVLDQSPVDGSVLNQASVLAQATRSGFALTARQVAQVILLAVTLLAAVAALILRRRT